MRSPATWLLRGLVLLLLATPGRADEALAEQALAALRKHCAACHGSSRPAKGGFGFVLDRDRLVARRKLIPGNPDGSEILERIVRDEMPPEGRPRLAAGDTALLRRWIEAGAPAAAASTPAVRALTPAEVTQAVWADLQALPARQRRFARYVTLAHLPGPAEVQQHRQALAKLLNSLSWHPRIAHLEALDPAGTVLRLDLRALQWPARLWERVIALYPYRVPDSSSAARAAMAATGTDLPVVRGDWLLATASRPPLYHDLLQLPTNDRELERLLRVDVLANIDSESVARAGFNDSGVSRNNRLIERHDAAFGAYWRSYDFSENTERQNLFEHPLGPFPGRNSFVQAGGEIIFHLPNGLQAYLLVDGAGRRVDRAPVEIVSDPRRPDRVVENGLSCMSCHVRGLIPRADQVRSHVEKNRAAFAAADVATVQALHVPEARLRALLEADSRRFLQALAEAGVAASAPEPVAAATERYEATLDAATAAAECGLSAAEFGRRLREARPLQRTLGPLLAPGGTVQRQVFVAAFPEIVRTLRLGDDDRPPLTADAVPAAPFAGHTGHVLALAVDGTRILSGSADRSVRLWDAATGKELRRYEGHTDEVLAVALAADGRRALSGGSDRTVRLWDLASGRELGRFAGHTERVSSVALAPDGTRALSGSWDQTLCLWDLERGVEVRRLVGHTGWVTSVAVAPDGRRALSGSYDGTVRLWDLTSGRELRRLEGHGREVYSVAFAPDGRRAASGGNDHAVRLWDLDTGREVRRLDGHANAVVRVAFSPDGRHLLSGSSQYEQADHTLRVWDAATGKALHSFPGDPAGVWSLAFAADGRSAVSARSDRTLRVWNLGP